MRSIIRSGKSSGHEQNIDHSGRRAFDQYITAYKHSIPLEIHKLNCTQTVILSRITQDMTAALPGAFLKAHFGVFFVDKCQMDLLCQLFPGTHGCWQLPGLCPEEEEEEKDDDAPSKDAATRWQTHFKSGQNHLMSSLKMSQPSVFLKTISSSSKLCLCI